VALLGDVTRVGASGLRVNPGTAICLLHNFNWFLSVVSFHDFQREFEVNPSLLSYCGNFWSLQRAFLLQYWFQHSLTF
jgi:hypothetical protein